jgi:putative PIN family toxin of toxin-antitoxin system
VLRAVLDANVYVSAAIRSAGPPGRLLERFLGGSAFEIVLAPAIIDEIVEVLGYPKLQKYLRADIDATTWFERIVALADLVAGGYEVPAVSGDPDDDKYLAAAAEGCATFVVTGDPDLLKVKEHAGVRIVSKPRTVTPDTQAALRSPRFAQCGAPCDSPATTATDRRPDRPAARAVRLHMAIPPRSEGSTDRRICSEVVDSPVHHESRREPDGARQNGFRKLVLGRAVASAAGVEQARAPDRTRWSSS